MEKKLTPKSMEQMATTRATTRARPKTKPRSSATIAPPAVCTDAEQRSAKIAERAYFRAQQRGFVPGYELDDWLAAESEVDGQTQLLGAASKTEIH